MTDNEIIKALECCKNDDCWVACKECPAVKYDICIDGTSKISNGVLNKVIDLINRQKAEIESLQQENKQIHDDCRWCEEWQTTELLGERAKAIKEFAEQVKMAFYYEFDELIPSIMADKIDNLVKEMTEGEQCEKD
mgnify:CR=1 FL=1